MDNILKVRLHTVNILALLRRRDILVDIQTDSLNGHHYRDKETK